MADKNTSKSEHEPLEETHETKSEEIKQETKDTLDEVTPVDVPKEDSPEKTGSLAVASQPVTTSASAKKSKFAWFKTKNGKITLACIAGVILLLAVLFAVPATRYGIMGSFIKKDVALSLIDSKTGKPVSDAEVSVPGTTGHTNNEGKATLSNVPVGQYTLTIKKKNYKDTSMPLTVPILSAADAGQLKLVATGRQVPITVTNKIGGQALANATITAGEATAITDAKGEATLVVPADATTIKAALKADKFNGTAVDITVTEQKDAKNTFAMTPSGTLYFLSKRTGKINVMKSDLDGSNAKVVVQGTGKEEEGGTVLLASRDWKYLLLKSRRDSDKPKLYLITTSNDKMDVVDEGNANFNLIGWNDHRFAYWIDRYDIKNFQPKKYAIKSFDADTAKLITLDETQGQGTDPYSGTGQYYGGVYLIDSSDTIVFTQRWDGVGYYNKPGTITAVQSNGANRRQLWQFEKGVFVDSSVLYNPDEIYFQTYQNGKDVYYEFDDGSVKASSTIKDSDFSSFYSTYLLSPSGEKTFWYEPRDGKNTLLVGDKSGENGKELATLSDYTPYGWYTDDFLLVSKGGSELYIVPSANPDFSKALKVTDYHKPNIVYRGYGGGYGGGF